MPATRLWFIRHGELEHGSNGLFIGRTEAGLSPLGRHQAEAIRAYLEDAAIDAVVSSPRKRAKDTVRPLASAAGKIIDTRPGFAEMDFGDWEGLGWQQIVARDEAFAAQWQSDPGDVACPGGESGNQFAARIDAALADLLLEFKGRSIALSAHAGTNRAILGNLLQRPYMEMFAFVQDYGCLNAAAWDADGHGQAHGQIALVNFVPGPRSAHPGNE